MEGKKISFGFKKIQKPSDSRLASTAPTLEQEEKKDYIDCLEENAIKVVGGEIIEEKKLLVIPMKPNTLTAERFQQIAAEVESALEETTEVPEKEDVKIKVENETLEEQAARELLEEAKNIKAEKPEMTVVEIQSVVPLTGQKEPTLEDYEAVPISDYGMAMLRGMGWTPGQARKYTQPVLRPKGLGLGADKLVKAKADCKGKKGADEAELKLSKGSFVRILAGKYNGAYGKVISLNEDSARVTVELALGRGMAEVGEQLLEPVTKDTYNERARVINSDKYEEYKRKEQAGIDNSSKMKRSENHGKHSREDDKNYKQKQKVSERYSSSSDEAHGREGKEKYRKRSDSESEQERKHRRDKQNIEKNNGKYRKGNLQRRSSSTEDERRSKNYNKESSNRSRRSQSHSPERGRRDRMRGRSNSRENDIKEHQKQESSSEEERSRSKHKKNKHRSRQSSSESSGSSEDRQKKKSKKRNETPVGKRDIDKKRKGKKKKRDRDRSPNYRKHKK